MAYRVIFLLDGDVVQVAPLDATEEDAAIMEGEIAVDLADFFEWDSYRIEEE